MKIKNIPANKLMGNGTSRVNEACKIYQGGEFDRALSVSPNICQLPFSVIEANINIASRHT